MRIGINLMPYVPQMHGGSEIYLVNIFEALVANNRKDEFILFGSYDMLNQLPDDLNIKKIVTNISNYQSRLARSIDEQIKLPFYSFKYKLDCMVSNYVVPIFSLCKQVVIIHDMLYKRYPESLEFKKLLFWRMMIPISIVRSSAVITVSNYSLSEILNYYPSKRDKIFVTVEGVRPSLIAYKNDPKSHLSDNAPYFVSVATFGRHKNIISLIDAFSLLPKEFDNIMLKIIGAARTPDAKKYRDKIIRMIIDHNLEKRIELVDHVSDGQLANLYKGALACVLPSLYEGFGLPIIEAQYFGCPVICSNRASMPEIGGRDIVMFDPNDSREICSSMMSIIRNPQLRDKVILSGYENVSKYSWEIAADQVFKAILGTQ